MLKSAVRVAVLACFLSSCGQTNTPAPAVPELPAPASTGAAAPPAAPPATAEKSSPEIPLVKFVPDDKTDGATLEFAPDRKVVVHALLMTGKGEVAQSMGEDPKPVAEIMDAKNDPDLGAFSVVEEQWKSGEPLCGIKPTVALVLSRVNGQPDKLAAITGAAPGEPGAMLCAIHHVKVVYPS